jgi:hypothetical protein
MPFECIANTLQQKNINYFRNIEYRMLKHILMFQIMRQ